MRVRLEVGWSSDGPRLVSRMLRSATIYLTKSPVRTWIDYTEWTREWKWGCSDASLLLLLPKLRTLYFGCECFDMEI